MRRTFLLATALMITASTVARALDPGMIAQGQVLSGMARGYAEPRRGSPGRAPRKPHRRPARPGWHGEDRYRDLGPAIS